MNTFYAQPLFSPYSNTQIVIYQPSSPEQPPQSQFSPQIISLPNANISNIPISIIPVNQSNTRNSTSSRFQNNSQLSNYQISNSMNNSNISNSNDFKISYPILNNGYSPYQNIPQNYQTNNYIEFSGNEDYVNNDEINKSDEFKTSIRLFIQHLELNEGEQSITAPSVALGIKRRRLYDVVNVFESIGCCKKCALDSVIWIGKTNISNTFDMLIKQKNLNNPSLSLADLFPIDQCIGVSNLTSSFVLLFYALKVDHLDLRYVAHFFSRKSSRYKTTLCKLYQISYIMNAVELMSRTSQVCEVVISKQFFRVEVLPEISDRGTDAVSIQSLLINENKDFDMVMKRRKEFKQYFLEHMKQ